ncbi:DNA-directed RNA polymerase II [Aureococcus anophagefferens]|uniref:DNA-directed RNA polymerase II n=1 Tax=Aureococcus anophagefferens TaxID=44056 RepID=A0ABR1FY23_AURAN
MRPGGDDDAMAPTLRGRAATTPRRPSARTTRTTWASATTTTTTTTTAAASARAGARRARAAPAGAGATRDSRDPERRFCPQCGNMWQPREARATAALMLTCRNCGDPGRAFRPTPGAYSKVSTRPRARSAGADARHALVRHVGRTDVDSTELESSKFGRDPPNRAVDLGAQAAYEEPAHTGKVYENRLKKEVSTRLDTISAEVVQDPTLQRSAPASPGPRPTSGGRPSTRAPTTVAGGARARASDAGAPHRPS